MFMCSSCVYEHNCENTQKMKTLHGWLYNIPIESFGKLPGSKTMLSLELKCLKFENIYKEEIINNDVCQRPEVLYLCDRRQHTCGQCSEECSHTVNIEHAKSFEKGSDGKSYWEKETPSLSIVSGLIKELEEKSVYLGNLQKEKSSFGCVFKDNAMTSTFGCFIPSSAVMEVVTELISELSKTEKEIKDIRTKLHNLGVY